MSQATRILLALVLGLAIGVGLATWSPTVAEDGLVIAQPIGTAWLNALQMTIVPLVVSLLITGVAATAAAARAGQVAGRALGLFIGLLWFFSAFAAIATPLLLGWFPLPAEAATALRAALGATAPVGPVPPFADFIVSIVPTNPVTAAATNAFLPLIVFTMVFAFALTRLPAEPRDLLTKFFQAVADVMLIIIGWILWLAPIGVLALAYVVGAKAGTAAFGALLHYVLIISSIGILVWTTAYPIGAIGGRIGLARFARATGPAQAVAISTQSSLASLPAMLRGAEGLGVLCRDFRRHAAARRRDLPRDRAADEPRGRHLCRLLVRRPARSGAARRGRSGRRDHHHGRGQPAGADQLRHLDRADLHRDGRAGRPARPAGRGRDHSRHLPHARQCHDGPGDDGDGVGPQRGSPGDGG